MDMALAYDQRVLVVDDDPSIGQALSDCLRSAGFSVTVLVRGRDAADALRKQRFAVCLVDLQLPDIDGMELVKELAHRGDTGIVILSGSTDRLHRVLGFELGADDYITKPFDSIELVARVKSLIRRLTTAKKRSDEAAWVQTYGEWTFDRAERSVVRNNQAVLLSPTEFKLLTIFTEHPRRVLERGVILDLLYGNADAPFDRSVDTAVTRLRQKIERNPKHPRYIKTIRFEGYIFDPDGKPLVCPD
jgi:DNA-binding response OmpR family regulator